MKFYFEVWKKYATFRGRASRAEYWYFVLFHFLAFISIILIGAIFRPFLFVYFIYAIAAFLPSLSVAVRRMHDVNKSGWYAFIPIYNFILVLTAGTEGDNRYGTDPSQPEFNNFLEERTAA